MLKKLLTTIILLIPLLGLAQQSTLPTGTTAKPAGTWFQGSDLRIYNFIGGKYYPYLTLQDTTSTIQTIQSLNPRIAAFGDTRYLRVNDTASLSHRIDQKISLSEKNAANGVATLDGGGKVPLSELPANLLIYKGQWNPATNSPSLVNGTGTTGDVWEASADGDHNFGAGTLHFLQGDFAIYNGSAWQLSAGTNRVTSVNGYQGIVVLNTDDVAEGTTNKYYTDARAAAYGDARYLMLAGTGQTVSQEVSFSSTVNVGYLVGSQTWLTSGFMATDAGFYGPSLTIQNTMGASDVLTLNAPTLTTGHLTQSFQNKSGTVALTSDLVAYAPLASPALTGTPTAPTATVGTNTTQIATTAFVTAAVPTNYITTNTTQASLTGDKTTSGTWQFGKVGIGSTNAAVNLYINKSITGGTTSYGAFVGGAIQSDVSIANLYSTSISTQATSFILNTLVHYNAAQSTIGSGSSITIQAGFHANSNLSGATSNYGFWGSLAAATGSWNLYMNGTAANYLAGTLSVGTNTVTANISSLSTTEQLRLLYDATHSVSHTVDASGNYTITPTGGQTTFSGTTNLTWNSSNGTLYTNSSVTIGHNAGTVAGNVSVSSSRLLTLTSVSSSSSLGGILFNTNNTAIGKMFTTGDFYLGSSPTDNGYKLSANVSGTSGYFSAGNFSVDASGNIITSSAPAYSTGGWTAWVRNNTTGRFEIAPITGTVSSVATDATLTGGTITSTGTLGIDLSHANTWTGFQTLSVGATVSRNVADGATTFIVDNHNLSATGDAQQWLFNGSEVAHLEKDGTFVSNGNIHASGDIEVSSIVQGSQFRLTALNTAPSSSADTGTAGEIRFTSTGIFWCISTNSWIKVTGSTF